MARAVASVSKSPAPAAHASTGAQKPQSTDGDSFSDALDRAKVKSTGSSTDGDGGSGQSQNGAATKTQAAAKIAAKKLAQIAVPAAEEDTAALVDPGQAAQAADSQPVLPATASGTEVAETPKTAHKKDAAQPPAKTADPDAAVVAGTQLGAQNPVAVAPVHRAEDRQSKSSSQQGITRAASSDDQESSQDQQQVDPDPATGSQVNGAVDRALPRVSSGKRAKTSTDSSNADATDPQDASVKAASLTSVVAAPVQPAALADDSDQSDASTAIDPAAPAKHAAAKQLDDLAISSVTQQSSPGGTTKTAAAASSTGTPTSAHSDSQFAQSNHAKIVSEIQGRLLPNGGSMHLRLEPPELGALHIHVEMRDGVVTASFETSTDQTSKLLSHSLGDLKTALESQGVSVQKLQVTQTPRQQSSSSSGDGQKSESQGKQAPAQQEQQRKELLKRMWQKLMNGQDPVDLVA